MTEYAYAIEDLGPYTVDLLDHAGLLHFAVKRYRCPGMTYDDITQDAWAALCVAARRRDPLRGTFSTWAVCLIRCHLLTAIANNRRVGRFGGRGLNSVVTYRLRKAMRRSPSLSVNDARTVLVESRCLRDSASDDTVIRAMDFAENAETRLDVEVPDEDGELVPMGRLLPDESGADIEQEVLMRQVWRAVDGLGLSPRDRDIIVSRMDSDETLASIGDRYGLSRERVRQIESVVLRRIRRAVGA
jgi:RNA polymerase sigma-32 factor